MPRMSHLELVSFHKKTILRLTQSIDCTESRLTSEDFGFIKIAFNSVAVFVLLA